MFFPTGKTLVDELLLTFFPTGKKLPTLPKIPTLFFAGNNVSG